jgi:antitoxin ParD1/3/4
MNVQLSPELERLVQIKVQSGRYNSASEVVGEALRLMLERDQMMLLQRDEIRSKINEGLHSLREGQGVDGEAVFERIEAELNALEHDSPK